MTDDPDATRLGVRVPGFAPPPRPDGAALSGRFVRLERLHLDHADTLFAANAADNRIWDYLPYGPFATRADYRDWVARMAVGSDPLFYALCDPVSGAAAGVASFLRIAPEAGSIEVGHITLSAALQRTPAATEAMALMMGWAFAAGYRRYEWKCNALNAASCRAAERLGFRFEGVFRQAGVVKGRNRDTAWFSVIDREWPGRRAAFAAWLDPQNFDAAGQQQRSLTHFIAGAEPQPASAPAVT